MFSDPLLSALNIILAVGIVMAVVASLKVKKMNKELLARKPARKKKSWAKD